MQLRNRCLAGGGGGVAVAAWLAAKAEQRVRDEHQQKGHGGNNPRLQSAIINNRTQRPKLSSSHTFPYLPLDFLPPSSPPLSMLSTRALNIHPEL